MKAYKYINEDGLIEWLKGDFNWRSLCHNEDVMDNYAMYLKEDFLGADLGLTVCRRCGSLSDFVMKRK